ncbi:MAG: shikimate dehydrogenase [Lachnospiraceae bacterium]|nr:shikimate dehydrogenase [Lachnospiraceae bacterium]MDE7415761.1 shikimate dehydrogenase [Lachnospiraceae bacterium]
MQINGKTKVYGIIGNPVEHTLSPLIHGTFADALGIDLVYVPFHVADGQLEAALKGAYGLNIQGMNVTVPYKNAVIPFLTEVDVRADELGAVNTLVRDGRADREGFIGYNTDISGLWRAMDEDGISLNKEEVIILGVGGVGRAVTFMCANSAKKVYLLNRSAAKADAVAAEVNSKLGRYGKDCVTAMALSDYKELLTGAENRYVVIQCTSVGLAPNVDDVVIDDGDFYHYVKYGYDLIYTPWETKFMKLVKDNGGMAYNGLKMLLYQGVDAFEIWNGCKVTKEITDKAYQRLCEKLR